MRLKMYVLSVFFVLSLMTVSTFVRAQMQPAAATATATTTASAPALEKSKAETTLEKIDKALPGGVTPWAAVLIGFLAEMLVRMWPTLRPKSFLLLASRIFELIASIAKKLSDLLDKLCQNLKD